MIAATGAEVFEYNAFKDPDGCPMDLFDSVPEQCEA
jgi:hypothetical protein